MLSIVNVAYPLAAVGPDTAGGAEQVLAALDRALVAAGHRSVVLASEESQVAGELVAVPAETGGLDEAAMARARTRTRTALRDLLARRRVDVVHMHGVDFDSYLPPSRPPVLATLHCPPDWYSAAALHPTRADTWLNAVSARQDAALRPNPHLLAPIENGVEICPVAPHARRSFALTLSRIAPEKGTHIALQAAHRSGLPLLVAGRVYAYPEHERYFAAQVAPHLDRLRRCIGPVGGARKRRLLSAARCLLIPSLVEETSSLAAREALAAGTPVIAFAAGALADTIEHGRTGFLVRDADEMAAAMLAAPEIAPDACRRAARQRFAVDAMLDQYLALYAALAGARSSKVASS